MNGNRKRWALRAAAAAALAAAAVLAWRGIDGSRSDEGLVSGNGRVEAVEIDLAAKIPGRVKSILVREGDFVKAGQTLAVIDTLSLDAQLRQAEAEGRRARSAVATAGSQRLQREAELDAARKRAARSAALTVEGASSQQEADDDRARVLSAEAALAAAETQVEGARAAVEAAQAAVERVRADIADSRLKAPRDGRVQYLVAREGEVLGAGGRVLNLLDLSDVYMTFFLPTAAAGRLTLGDEARIVLDAAPDFVVPARISFVASEAQFTPKSVETPSEREKLMFRVRAQIPAELLRKHITRVKTGLPGVAYVRRDSKAGWPERLRARTPP